MLKTEYNHPDMAARILDAFNASEHTEKHGGCAVNYEHGQHWISCCPCGALWSVVDAEGRGSIDGFDFEEIEDGDGSCFEDDE